MIGAGEEIDQAIIDSLLSPEDDRIKGLLKHKPDFKKIKIRTPSKEDIAKRNLEELKDLYLESNPYKDAPGVIGGPASQWGFDHWNKIEHLKNSFEGLGYPEMLEDFNKWKLQQDNLAEKEKEQAIKDNLKEKAGIIFDDIQDENVKKYILYMEKYKK